MDHTHSTVLLSSTVIISATFVFLFFVSCLPPGLALEDDLLFPLLVIQGGKHRTPRGHTRNTTPCRPDPGPDPAHRRHHSSRGVRDFGWKPRAPGQAMPRA